MFERLFGSFSKRDNPPDLATLQEAVVRSVAGDVTNLHDGEWQDREWMYLAINHEVLVEDGRRSSTQAKVLAQRPGGELEDLGFRLSPQTKGAILELRDAMAAKGQKTWTIMDLTVERSGRFNFDFSYNPPPRINGDLLHSPLKDLLERYRRDHP
jgi:hypothetical protein